MSKCKDNQTGDEYQSQMTGVASLGDEMGKVSCTVMAEETKGSVHVLQQVGGLLPAHLGPQALSLNSATVWGDISTNILKDKDMLKNLGRVTDLLLSLSNITKAVFLGFYKGQKLLQIQLIQVHVWDLSDLEDMDEGGATRTFGCIEGRLVSAMVGKLICIKRREKFMQDLGVDINNISAELISNISNSYYKRSS